MSSNNKARTYVINFTTDYNLSPTTQLYKTPDEALEAVYEDARKHGVKNLHVMIWPYDLVGLKGNSVGYSWEISETSSWKFRDNEINSSNAYIWDAYILGGVSPLEYPNPKPEFEVLDHLRYREIYWCNRACHSTVEEWKDSWDDEIRGIRKGKTEVEELEERYREAGYDLSKFTGWESLRFDEFVTK